MNPTGALALFPDAGEPKRSTKEAFMDDRDQRDTTASIDPDRAPAQLDRELPENTKENLDEKLDQGVEETFPGSDPVSVKITK